MSYDDLIYGPDGDSPLRPSLERAFSQAAADEQRLKITIRTTPQGVPSSRQEHSFAIDPDPQHIEAVMRVICERLTDSPGEHFAGEIRINYFAAGSGTIRYGSFTRQIQPRRSLRGSRGAAPSLDDLMSETDDDEDGDNSLGELNIGGINPQQLQVLQQLLGGRLAGPYDPEMRSLLETTWGFLFRSQAQQFAMSERIIGMVETFSMRFGMPHPHERGLIEDSKAPQNAGLAGMLPQLINAASHLAGANNPTEAAQRAGSLAAGNAPPDGAARRIAQEGAGRLVRNLQRGWASRGVGEPAESNDGGWASRGVGEPAEPDDGWAGMPGGGDNSSFALDRYRGEADYTNNEGPPDMNNMSGDQMITALRDWVAVDPDTRKGEIRNRMGELADLVI